MAAGDQHLVRRRARGLQVCACTPRHTKRRPNFARVLAIHADGVVRCCATLSLSLRVPLIARGAGVDEQASPREAQLETEGVSVRMSRLMVRADRSAIAQQAGRTQDRPNVAARLKRHQSRARIRHRIEIETPGVPLERSGRWGDTESGVVEESNLPVRVRHHLEPAAHSGDHPEPIGRWRAGVGTKQIDQVEQVLEHQRVVHRAQFEMTTIGEYLLMQFTLDDGHPVRIPPFSLRPAEIQPRVHERLCVGEQVIAQQVVFQPTAEPAGLHRQAGLAYGG